MQVSNVSDNHRVSLGEINLHFWHTPGHTPESCTILLENAGDVAAAFTGDTLFLGDVGRPDLAANSDQNVSKFDLASMMFDSIRRLSTLPESVVVFPGHGAGSACGKNISNATSCTIGNQKKTNYALLIEDRERFIESLTDNIPPPSDYFFHNVSLNKDQTKPSTEKLVAQGAFKMTPEEVHASLSEDVIVLDCRSLHEFEQAHVPGSLFSPLQGQLAIYAANILGEVDRPVIVVCPPGSGKECIVRLSRTGIDKVIGFLDDFESYRAKGFPVESVYSISADALLERIYESPSELDLVDVRGLGEYNDAHLPDSQLLSLTVLRGHYEQLDQQKELMIYCAAGLRSVIAYAFLKKKGYKNVTNITGGFQAIARKGIKIVKK